jgi:asparagine synthase (glutamine-hydrolysing)
VREEIELSVGRQLRSDVPVGSCLSGGLDSGAIVTSVGRLLGPMAGEFQTLTLSNEGFEEDETELARATAARAGVKWVRVEPSPAELGADLERVIRMMGEPFGGLSILGQYKVMQQARAQGLKVMLDGQGADEVFLGYRHVAVHVPGEHLRRGRIRTAGREWWALRRNASLPFATTLLGHVLLGCPRLVGWHNSRPIRPLVDPSLLGTVRTSVAEELYSHRSIHGLQLREITRRPLPCLLRFEDRNSMAFGLEARVPLLAPGVVESVLPLPWHWKVRDGWTKYALRMAMQERLPGEVLWQRRKRGFEVPQRRWVEAARPLIAGWLADLPPDCPIRVPEVLARVDAGYGGQRWLWRCLSVALWMRFSGVRG